VNTSKRVQLKKVKKWQHRGYLVTDGRPSLSGLGLGLGLDGRPSLSGLGLGLGLDGRPSRSQSADGRSG
jgi:hypothetical protein